MEKDYYLILGISRDAKKQEIKKAYRKLALKVHPDRNAGNPIYEEIFKDVKEAYETLIDKRKRANYDSSLFHGNQKYQKYNNIPPQDVVKKIIVEIKKIVIVTEGRATPTINRIQINNYLKEILSPDVILVYNAVSEKQKKELIFFTVPLFRYINDSQRAEYFRVVSKIIGNNDALITYVRKRIDEVIRNQKKIDKRYWLTYKVSSFISTKWGRLISTMVSILIFYFFISILDNANNNEVYFPQKAINTEIIQNKKNTSIKLSRWKWNQLKTGDSPYDKYFGKGIYAKNFNKIIFQNDRKLDVVVCLVGNSKTIRNKYIRSGETYIMTNIPNGNYIFKIYYGKYWNPDLKILGKSEGGFDTLAGFSRSYYQYEFKQNQKHYTEYKIDIPSVEPGSSRDSWFSPIDANEFFNR